MIKVASIFFIVGLFITQNALAADTLKLTKPISLDKIGREYAPGYLLINNKIIRIPYVRNNGFFNNLSYPHNKFSQVYFRNSSIGVYESSEIIGLPMTNSGFYIIDSCKIDLLPIAGVSGNVTVTSSLMNTLFVENSSDLKLSLSYDSSISYILLQDNKNLEFQLQNCIFKDSGKIRIFNTTFKSFEFSYDKRSGCNILFQTDTINNFSGVSIVADESDFKNYRTWYKHENIFTFRNCYINAPFVFFDHVPNSTIIFNNCTFGPNAYLADMAVDKLVFRNCQNFSEQIMIGFRKKNIEVELGLVNSNLDNIRFDFAPNVKLVFDSLDSKDVITNSYKYLLEKFEHEGKDRSYKMVDLQYRNFNDSGIFHFLNYVWWYHGYMPGLVFAWTILFILAFFVFNLKHWTKMIEVYPLREGQKAAVYNQKDKKLRYYSIVLLYTCFIFFSLRVDFHKINFKQYRFIYALLGQYLVGLWCMIFIIRFIFKL